MDEKKEIAYQNKDIMSKVLADEFKGKSFEAYGVYLPKIVDSRPTELAAVEANELRLDRIFELEDKSYLIVDYESDYSESKKHKYLGYVARLAKTLYNELKYYPKMRVLIIYTADVKRTQTKPDLSLGDFTMHIEEAFLSEIDAEELWVRISENVRKFEKLEDKDLMQLIIYPLTFIEREEKQIAIQRAIELVDEIRNENQRIFALKGLLVFCDKVILMEDADKIRRMLMLTKVEQIIEKEKQDAIAENTKKVTTSVTASVTDGIAKNLLRSGSSPEYVAQNTGLSIDYIMKLNLTE